MQACNKQSNTIIMQVADHIRPSMKGNSKEVKKIKQEWVTSLFDAMAMAGKMQNDVNFLRKEKIRPCLVAAAKEICSKQTPVTEWLFGDDLPKRVEHVSKFEKLPGKLKQKPQNQYRPYDKDQRARDAYGNRGYQHVGSKNGRDWAFRRSRNNYYWKAKGNKDEKEGEKK